MSEQVLRIAARGDGVTASGRFVAGAAPGDRVEDGKVVERGEHYQEPPCRHFPECGGCQLQHLDDAAYAEFVSGRVAAALDQHGLSTTLRPAHLSPPCTRRRASLKAMKTARKVLIGFNEQRSHRIVDMLECHVLAPELFTIIEPLRGLLAKMMAPKRPGAVQLSLTDQGVDVGLSGVEAEGLEAAEALIDFAREHALARLSIDEGFGLETRYEPRPVTVTLSGTAIPFPAGSFLQATSDGEEALVAAVRDAIGDAKGRVLDLFAGLGTFACAIASAERPVSAAEAGRDAALSLKAGAARAGLPVAVEHRDLYRRPYDPSELEDVAAVILDPPRSGAEAQCAALSGSNVPTVAYVSCNPATFARDAEQLVKGGYRLQWVQPVGQFRWSTHVELAAAFTRQA
ncbi:class I SAM-dependent RNA methyltransferase [Sphingomicrobium lutaoense]|uniref:23S rRNA (Uracil1939-C5)-methyltransferase n=1 Tax=Sphingomicrobium lutaoense TaxID=515949 RepID=A0A839YU15_9SPHN|nr:class I SAM-dependent RNA methyltransferase [Sphingomicrobium lutaoense]MBB3763751.1 23S rRNA (uracil1939-C5)-methyltransferase [Sphingomicrobium lutaoense]